MTSNGVCTPPRNECWVADTLFAEIGFGIGEVAAKTNLRDNVGALWLPFKVLSVQGEQTWQRMIVGLVSTRAWRVSRLPKHGNVQPFLRMWRSALQVRCLSKVVVPQGSSLANANVLHIFVGSCPKK